MTVLDAYAVLAFLKAEAAAIAFANEFGPGYLSIVCERPLPVLDQIRHAVPSRADRPHDIAHRVEHFARNTRDPRQHVAFASLPANFAENCNLRQAGSNIVV